MAPSNTKSWLRYCPAMSTRSEADASSAMTVYVHDLFMPNMAIVHKSIV